MSLVSTTSPFGFSTRYVAMPAVFPFRARSTGRNLGGDGVHQRGVALHFGVASRLAAADHPGGQSARRVRPDCDVGQAEIAERIGGVAPERSPPLGAQHVTGPPT